MEKIDLRNASKEEKEAIRIRTIRMYKQKKTQKEISIMLGVHKNSVNKWVKQYKLHGIKGLKESKRGHKEGIGRLLTLQQEQEIQKMIVDKMPDQLKLPFGLWTRKAIIELI